MRTLSKSGKSSNSGLNNKITKRRGSRGPGAERRRGVVLLFVVGILALIAAIAAIYVAIGQSDRRVASALASGRDTVDVGNSVGQYFSGVVADDRLDYVWRWKGDLSINATNPDAWVAEREAWDGLTVDYTARSSFAQGYDTSVPDASIFRPAGGPGAVGGRPQGLTPGEGGLRVFSDPWLASTLPEYLGNPEVRPDAAGYSAAVANVFGASASDIEERSRFTYLDDRDWRQISNMSPTGRFSNLFALRPDGTGDQVSYGFDATPNDLAEYLAFLMPSSAAGGAEGVMATQLLSLNPADYNYNQLAVLFNRTDFNPYSEITDPGTGAQVRLMDIPAIWSTHQRHLMLPANQAFRSWTRNGVQATWADRDYLPYSYADADGDGFFDSRWFELSSDLNLGLVREGGWRFFAAARAIDLNSMINVSTASDSLMFPINESPWGLSASEIDLRRLLTGELLNPAIDDQGVERQFFSPFYDPTDEVWLSAMDFHDPDGNLDYYSPGDFSYFSTYGGGDAQAWAADANEAMRLAGVQSFFAIKAAVHYAGGYDDQFFFSSPDGPVWPLSESPFDLDTGDDSDTSVDEIGDGVRWGMRRMLASYRAFTSIPANRRDLLNTALYEAPGGNLTNAIAARSVLDETSLFELLAFFGANDDRRRSRLETLSEGRDAAFAGTDFGPMRATRPTFAERRLGDAVVGASRYDGISRPDGNLDLQELARLALDPRRYMTTINGAAELRQRDLINAGGSEDSIDRGQLRGLATTSFEELLYLGDAKVQIADLLNDIVLGSQRTGAERLPGDLFKLYFHGLAPYANFGNENAGAGGGPAWDEFSFPETSTLHYGWRSPELSMRLAAHMTANMIDLYDLDLEPRAYTLLVDADYNPDTAFFPWFLEPADPAAYDPWLGTSRGGALPGGDGVRSDLFPTPRVAERMAGSGSALDFIEDEAGNNQRQAAVTVFGLEPHPVLVHAASAVVYYDTPAANGGDSEWTSSPPPQPVTIDATYPTDETSWTNNPDFLFELVAFQVANPYNVPISLNRRQQPGSSGTGEWLYYVEWNGRYFPLLEAFDDGGVTYNDVVLQPGETRVFYHVSAENLELLADKLNAVMPISVTFNFSQSDGTTETATVNSWDQALAGGAFQREDNLGNPEFFLLRWFISNRFLNAWGTRIPQFNPAAGGVIDGYDYAPLLNEYDDDSSNNPAAHGLGEPVLGEGANRSVRLWRAMGTGVDAGNDNDLSNDMLVDRLSQADPFDPTAGELNVLLPSGSQDVQGTTAGEEGTPGAADNTGFYLARWAAIGRPRFPAPTTARGSVPAYLFEYDFDDKAYPENDIIVDDASSLQLSDFDGSRADDGADTGRTAGALLTAGASVNAPSSGFNFQPFIGGIGSLTETGTTTNPRNPRRTIRTDLVVQPFEIGLPNNLFRTDDDDDPFNESFGETSLMRTTDLLRPLAVGTIHRQDFDNTQIVEGEWITFTEMLSMAGGGADPVLGEPQNTAADPNGFYFDLDDVLDRGRLYLDRFVPFVNNNDPAAPGAPGARVINPWAEAIGANANLVVFDPGTDDVLRGLGVPFSIGLLDLVTTQPVRQSSMLTRAIAGRLNPGTAPLQALRAVPGFAPDITRFDSNGDGVISAADERAWWGEDLGMRLEINGVVPDIASTLVAYRDRARATPRYVSADMGDAARVEYRPSTDGLAFSNYEFEPADPAGRRRSFWTGIDGLRNEPGIRTPGEVATAILNESNFESVWTGDYDRVRANLGQVWGTDNRTINNTTTLFADGATPPDRAANELEFSRTPLMPTLSVTPGGGTLGIEPYPLYDDTGSFSTERDRVLVPDTIRDDYHERLLATTGAYNSLTTRTDLVAVWFVVHGFREDSVENLSYGEPLLPDFKERYLMVLDRSNVTKLGDQPRVVLFERVPE